AGRPASRLRPQPRVQEGLAGMILVRTRPLQAAERFEPRVAHTAREVRRDHTEFVPDSFGGPLAPVVAETLRELRDDPQLVFRAGRRIDRLPDALHAALAVRDGPFAFTPRRTD